MSLDVNITIGLVLFGVAVFWTTMLIASIKLYKLRKTLGDEQGWQHGKQVRQWVWLGNTGLVLSIVAMVLLMIYQSGWFLVVMIGWFVLIYIYISCGQEAIGEGEGAGP